jgi:hypothetical protein
MSVYVAVDSTEYVVCSVIPAWLRPAPLYCFSDDGSTDSPRDLLVMAAAAKGGAVLSARIVAELGTSCGVCIASGERSAAGIPGPVEELPVYEGQLLHAIINMRPWPQYARRHGYTLDSAAADAMQLVGTRSDTEPAAVRNVTGAGVRCVVILRDPASRLQSLYTYARSGGEHWFRYQSGIMAALASPNITLSESLSLFWNGFGRDYLMQSHEYLVYNLKLGCKPVTMEAFKANYSEAVKQIMVHYNVRSEVIPLLLSRLSGADLSRKTEEQKKADKHVTANKFSPALLAGVKEFLHSDPEVSELVRQQRIELGYR